MNLLLLSSSTAFINSTGSWGKQVIQQAKATIHLAFIASIKGQELLGKTQRKQMHRKLSQGKNDQYVIKEEAFKANIYFASMKEF